MGGGGGGVVEWRLPEAYVTLFKALNLPRRPEYDCLCRVIVHHDHRQWLESVRQECVGEGGVGGGWGAGWGRGRDVAVLKAIINSLN